MPANEMKKSASSAPPESQTHCADRTAWARTRLLGISVTKYHSAAGSRDAEK